MATNDIEARLGAAFAGEGRRLEGQARATLDTSEQDQGWRAAQAATRRADAAATAAAVRQARGPGPR